jgi:hypothetical protein
VGEQFAERNAFQAVESRQKRVHPNRIKLNRRYRTCPESGVNIFADINGWKLQSRRAGRRFKGSTGPKYGHMIWERFERPADCSVRPVRRLLALANTIGASFGPDEIRPRYRLALGEPSILSLLYVRRRIPALYVQRMRNHVEPRSCSAVPWQHALRREFASHRWCGWMPIGFGDRCPPSCTSRAAHDQKPSEARREFQAQRPNSAAAGSSSDPADSFPAASRAARCRA